MTSLRAARIPATVAILIAVGLIFSSAVGVFDGLDYFFEAAT